MKKQLILTAGIVLSACSSNGQNSNQSQYGYNAPQNMAGQYQMAGYNHPMAAQGQIAVLNSGGCAPAPVPTPCSRPVSPCAPAPVPTPCAQAQMAQYAQGGVRGGGFPWALGGAALGAGAIALIHNNGNPSYPEGPFIEPPKGEPGEPTTGGPTTGFPTTGTPIPWTPTTGFPTTGFPTTGFPTTGTPTTGGPLIQATGGPVKNPTVIVDSKGRIMNPAFMGGMNRMGGQHGLRSSYVAPKDSYAYGEVGVVNQDAGKSFGGVQGRAGYQSAYVIGGELEGSVGVVGKKNVASGDLAVGESKLTNIDHSMAGFVTARVPLGSRVKALARVGMHSTKASYADGCTTGGTGTGAGTGTIGTGGVRPLSRVMGECEGGIAKSTDTHTGVALGGGLEASLTDVDSIRADVTAYDMGEKFRKAVSVGYLRKF